MTVLVSLSSRGDMMAHVVSRLAAVVGVTWWSMDVSEVCSLAKGVRHFLRIAVALFVDARVDPRRSLSATGRHAVSRIQIDLPLNSSTRLFVPSRCLHADESALPFLKIL